MWPGVFSVCLSQGVDAHCAHYRSYRAWVFNKSNGENLSNGLTIFYSKLLSCACHCNFSTIVHRRYLFLV